MFAVSSLLLEEPYFLSFPQTCCWVEQISCEPAAVCCRQTLRNLLTLIVSFSGRWFSFGTKIHHRVFSRQLWPRLDSCWACFLQSNSNRKSQFVFFNLLFLMSFFIVFNRRGPTSCCLHERWCLQGHHSVLGKVSCQQFVCVLVTCCGVCVRECVCVCACVCVWIHFCQFSGTFWQLIFKKKKNHSYQWWFESEWKKHLKLGLQIWVRSCLLKILQQVLSNFHFECDSARVTSMICFEKSNVLK